MFLKDIFLWFKFLTVLGIFTYFNIAKMPYLDNLSHIQNLNIFRKRNFWLKKQHSMGVLRYGLGHNKPLETIISINKILRKNVFLESASWAH